MVYFSKFFHRGCGFQMEYRFGHLPTEITMHNVYRPDSPTSPSLRSLTHCIALDISQQKLLGIMFTGQTHQQAHPKEFDPLYHFGHLPTEIPTHTVYRPDSPTSLFLRSLTHCITLDISQQKLLCLMFTGQTHQQVHP